MGGTATGGTKVNETVVSLTALQLEGDTNVTAIVGLEAVGGSNTPAEGGDVGVGKDTAVTSLVTVVVAPEADDTERGGKSDGLGLTGAWRTSGEVLNIGPHGAFGGKK